MPITDLVPWRRRKKTRVPIKVRDQSVRALEGEAGSPADEWCRWLGLAPFGVFGRWWGVFGPRMDMVEYEDGFRVIIDVPGMDKDDIRVTLSGERLTVRGNKQEGEVDRTRRHDRVRSRRSAFRRSILLPCPIEAEDAEASLSRGVLTISLPKAERGRHKRQIRVNSA